jgi:hypothetical protein
MKENITELTKGFHKNILMNLLNTFNFKSIKDFQKHMNITQDGIFGMQSYKKFYNTLLQPKDVDFEGFYTKQSHPKSQIILHHSAGWDNARGMFDWWKKDGVNHVATSIGINDNGELFRGFDEGFWASSIGCDSKVFIENNIPLRYNNGWITNNVELDKGAVAVEICNWGALKNVGGKYYSWANIEIPENKVIRLDYKGVQYYEKYTEQEVQTLKWWILLNAIRFQIPVNYDYDEMFSVSRLALSGVPGIYTHNSYKKDKSDISPQPKMLGMLNTLIDYTK